MITASAPGKVVLWGEYAVLSGAPAAVLAVDRRATCSISEQPDTERWHVASPGFKSEPVAGSLKRFLTEPQREPAVIHHALQALPEGKLRELLPTGASVILDTQAFQLHGKKLGIGSSAAISAATYAAFAALVGASPAFDQALQAHNHLQGKKGSGIDVAAAWHGGALRYQEGAAEPMARFDPGHWHFYWTGTPASTASHIDKFRSWADAGPATELDTLAALCEQLFAQDPQDLFPWLKRYVEALRSLDRAAGLGIYTPDHERLHQLAIDCQVVYKPCGAGGGDVGAAVGAAEDLATFARAAEDLGFNKLAITKADHGVQVSR